MVLYPVLVFIGFKYFPSFGVCLVLTFLLLARVAFVKNGKQSLPHEKIFYYGSIVIILASIVGFLFKKYDFIQLYPVVINLGLAGLFGSSLIERRMPVIERFARLTEKNLSSAGIYYTRQVTKVWLVFFVFNAFVSAYTYFFCSLEAWTFYNAFLSYILMGLLLGIEYLIRIQVRKSWESI